MKCPVCDCSKLKTVYENPLLELKEIKQSIAECPNCRLGVSLPQLGKDKLDNLYDENYPPIVEEIRPSKLSDESGVQVLYRKLIEANIALYLALPPGCLREIFMWNIMAALPVKCISPDLCKDHEFLDYGAGSWYFVNLLRANGYKAYGFDIFEASRKNDWFHDIYKDEKLFDEIRMFHVLEHVEDPGELLGFIYSRLKPGARLVLGVPNFSSPLHRLEPNGGHFHLPYHRLHFSEASLRIALAKAGFKVKHIITRSTEIGYVSYLINQRVSLANPMDKLFLKFQSTILDVLGMGDAYEVYAYRE